MAEGPLNDLHVFDTATATWRAVAARGTPPAPRSFHASAAIGARVFVFGGCGAAGRLNDLFAFDTASETWEEMPASPAVAVRAHQVQLFNQPSIVEAEGAMPIPSRRPGSRWCGGRLI